MSFETGLLSTSTQETQMVLSRSSPQVPTMHLTRQSDAADAAYACWWRPSRFLCSRGSSADFTDGAHKRVVFGRFSAELRFVHLTGSRSRMDRCISSSELLVSSMKTAMSICL